MIRHGGKYQPILAIFYPNIRSATLQTSNRLIFFMIALLSEKGLLILFIIGVKMIKYVPLNLDS